MTLPTPETLVRHELVGLSVSVVDAPNPDLIGVSGTVVDETTQTLILDAPAADATSAHREPTSRVRQIPKAKTQFEFVLADEAATGINPVGETSQRFPETTGTSNELAGRSEDREGVTYVTVDGERLLARPARRTEIGGVSQWH